MKRLKEMASFLASKTLLLWLLGLLVVYYLTVAVWFKEAFGTLVNNLSHSNLYRFFYLLFLANIALRSGKALIKIRSSKVRFFLRLPLFLGAIIFLFSAFMSLNVRDFRWLLLGTGDVVQVPWQQASLRIVHIDSAVKKKALRQDESAIFDYEPLVTLEEEGGVRHRAGAFPPRLVNSTFMQIMNFGIGPGIELRRGNAVVFKKEVALRVIPFGNTDSFTVEPLPYKFYVSIVPNRIIKKGKETARDYDLDRPRYRVEVVKGDMLIAQKETEDGLTFDQNMSLSFAPPSDWIMLNLVHDPFLAWFVVGLALMLFGLLLYPFSYLAN